MHTNTHTNPHLEAQYTAARELAVELAMYPNSLAFADAYASFKELQAMRKLQTT
jgi:hypothetical protein